ncbi:hypothetical protein Nepgr_009139 [Nepenthes gracilis]|uniref:Pentatricopeptide repeat-containing protein n=1 Tax=Nepenthes gracilis TaxID=150966 RepID=A0AAD3SAU6_NEPGR|nr:hypothetical protein Nepgr_009139 [Nepenthes gracilis]
MRALYSATKSSISLYYEATVNHCRAVKWGNMEDIYTANNIMVRYAKCGDLNAAHDVFDVMSHRDTVSWNSMISGYVNFGNVGTGWEILCDMKRHGFVVDGYTFGSMLKGVAWVGQLDIGEQLHSMIIKAGYQTNVFTGSAIIDMYSKCRRVDRAHVVFRRMPKRNAVSWNALIAGYVEEGDSETAFQLFFCMEDEGLKIDDGTIAPLLTLLDDPEFYDLTTQLHGKVMKHGLAWNNTLCNAITTSYSECGSLEDAERMFEGAVGIRDLVTWNSMLAAYLVHNEERLAFRLFLTMQEFGFEPDIYTHTSLISTCFEAAHWHLGKSLHGLVIKRGLERSTAISNSLIAMYIKSNGNSMEHATSLFGSLEWKDCVSWNSVLTGFSQYGLSEEALKFFRHMRFSNVAIDHYSFSAVLRSCSDLATLQLGQQVHVLAIKSGWYRNEHVASSLIFMYSKCGLIKDARKYFEDAPKNSSITWNSIIFGYAQHGQGKVALQLFDQMTEAKVKFDHITFVAVLTACSHIGLVEEGRHFLNSMKSDYGIPLRMEHYACGVDLFGRAGLLDEAKALLESMPFEPDATVLLTLLGACRYCGDVEFANQIASHLLQLEPYQHCTYVILSDMYGRFKRWDSKARLTKLMRERGVKKVPGWSWIEIRNEVHAFSAEDCSHSKSKEIYHILGGLMEEISLTNCIYDTNTFSVTW